MKKLEWSDKLNLGVKQIDEQHQRLVELVGESGVSEIPVQDRHYLQGLYKDSIEDLEKLLEKDLSAWKDDRNLQ